MSLRFRFFVVEALRSLRTNFATTLAATVTVLIVMFFFGVFVALGSYMYNKIEQVRQDVKVSVYLGETASKRQILTLRQQLLANPKVETVEYVSKAEALKRFRKDLGNDSEILDTLAVNPLPASLEVKTKSPDDTKAVAAAMRGQPGVEKGTKGVVYGGKTADEILRSGAIIELVIGALIVLLAAAAVLLISNTIRLSIFARRREVEVMKLVGATNWFVRLPFMLEGMICGLAGALISIGMLWAGYELLLRDRLQSSQFSGDNVEGISFVLLAALLLFAGTGLGALGSGITMRRFLRV
jgi:cell division transport system permease protein